MSAELPILYHEVIDVYKPRELHVGPFLGGRPMGVTVHHTADADLERVKRHAVKTKVGYHALIARDGKVHQTAFLDGRVNHAGRATWAGFSPNRAHLAIALLSYGRLENPSPGVYVAWNGAKISPLEVELRRDAWGKIAYWHVATEAQERTLAEVLAWLCVTFKIHPRHVAGHDEVALPAGRKDDPGGVLRSSMADVRHALERVFK